MAKAGKNYDEDDKVDDSEDLDVEVLDESDDADDAEKPGPGQGSKIFHGGGVSRPGGAREARRGGTGDDDEEGETALKKSDGKRYTQLSERNRCRFTRAGVERIDYKDVVTLQKLMTAQAKVMSRKRTGIAARYQRMVKVAIKRARFMALLPYVG